MIKNLPPIPLIVLMMLVSVKGFAQNFTAMYSFTNVSTSSGRTDPTPPPTATGLSFGSFSATSTLPANPNAPGRFTFTNQATGASNGSDVFTGTTDLTKYYEVTITPQANYSLKLDSITFTLQRSGTGIRRYAVRSNLDGYSSNLPAFIDPPNANLQVISGDVFQVSDAATSAENGSKIRFGAAFANLTTPVTFRFYGWNAEGTGGTFSIDNVLFGGATTISQSAPNVIVSTTAINFPPTAIRNNASASYIIRGENLSGSVTITTAAPYSLAVTEAGPYNTSLTIPASDLGSDKTIYIRFSPVASGSFPATISHSSNNANPRTINITGDGIDPANLTFNFDNCTTGGTPGTGFTTFSVTGAQTWSCSNFGKNSTRGVEMNGFSSGAVENDDWLISPSLSINSLNLPVLRFFSRAEFSGPSLQLLISTNYDGSGNPNTATWTELEGNFPPATNTWTMSDGIDLSAYKSAAKVYIAFRYTSSVELGAPRWTIDDVDVTNRSAILSANPASLSFDDASAGASSSALPFTVRAIGYGNVTITAPAHYQVSVDSVNYATSLIIPQATAEGGTKLFARFSPTSKELKIEAPIRFTGTGLDSSLVLLSGSSFPKSETFDAGAYNLSFFGSNPTNNPTPQKISTQVENIATVFNRLKLDVTGISEVSNDLALDSLTKKVPNSRAILSNRWSYSYDAADPNFPPQKIGFLFDTTTMKLVEARAMFISLYDSARTAFPNKLPNYPGGTPSSFWSSGRLPYMATFRASVNGVMKQVRIIVIHGKSASDAESYNRRVYDAKVLKDTIDAYYKAENVLIVGDFNDRLINSIYTGSPNSPYKPFIDDNTNYTGLTVPLDQAGRTSFIGGAGLIDHIVVTSSLNGSYISNSTAIEDPRTYISGYNATTGSDHLPVYSRFSFDVSLPVTLTKFAAVSTNNEVLVSWATASELHSRHFVVERSADSRVFKPVFTQVSFNSNLNSYQFIDASPLPGVSYYRLKQVDNDGRISLSKVVTVSFARIKNILTVYPNPVVNSIKIDLKSSASDLVVSLVNGKGVLVMQVKGDIYQCTRQLNDKIHDLNVGLYILKVVNKEENHAVKFLKQ